MTKVHVFPYSPRPGTRTAADDPVPAAVKKERSARLRAASDAACRARWARRVGSEDVVLVDRPGRGYADDYTPWLVDGAVGEMVRRAGSRRRATRGCSRLSQPDCLFCRLVADGDHVHAADGFVAIRDIAPGGRDAPARAARAARRHVPRDRRVPGRGGGADAALRGRGRGRRGARGLSRDRQHRAACRADRLPPPLARPRRKRAPGFH